MASQTELERIRDYLGSKIIAEKQKVDVVRKVREGKGEFILVDARDRASYAEGHIPGAINLPVTEVETRGATLSKDKEYVTYCWNHT